MKPLLTERLSLEHLTEDDAAFTCSLLNDPDFIAHIADRGIRDEPQARQYLLDGPIKSYREHGFGMYAMRLRNSGETVGMCGLVKRDGLDDVDIGYALLPSGRGLGYAREAAERVLQHAWEDIRLPRLVAIVSPDNPASIKLLESLGMKFESMVRLTPQDDEIRLYGATREGH
jgi:RimJ/RimL family protein N-acetyltransferase